MPKYGFQYLPKNKRRVKAWIAELVNAADLDEKRKVLLQSILQQRIWVSPMLNGNEVVLAFCAACRKLIKHRSISRLNFDGVLAESLKQWRRQKVPSSQAPH